MSNNNSSSSGLGIFSVVGIVFIVLKCVGVIDWSWWWVLSPFWIGFLFGISILLLILSGYFIFGAMEEYEKIRRKKLAERKKKENQDKENQEKE